MEGHQNYAYSIHCSVYIHKLLGDAVLVIFLVIPDIKNCIRLDLYNDQVYLALLKSLFWHLSLYKIIDFTHSMQNAVENMHTKIHQNLIINSEAIPTLKLWMSILYYV